MGNKLQRSPDLNRKFAYGMVDNPTLIKSPSSGLISVGRSPKGLWGASSLAAGFLVAAIYQVNGGNMQAKSNSDKSTRTKFYLALTISVTALLLAAIGSWLYINARNLDQQQKQSQAQLEADKKETVFKDNQACQKYVEGVKSAIDGNNANKFALDIETFETIYYSPRDNACLYAIQSVDSSGDNIGKRHYLVFNALTNSKVASFDFPQQYDAYKKYILDSSDGEVKL